MSALERLDDVQELWVKASRERDCARLDLSRAKDRIRYVEGILRELHDHTDVTDRQHQLLVAALENAWSPL